MADRRAAMTRRLIALAAFLLVAGSIWALLRYMPPGFGEWTIVVDVLIPEEGPESLRLMKARQKVSPSRRTDGSCRPASRSSSFRP